MLEEINHREYGDYLKYYSNISEDIVDFKILPEAANENDRVININLNLFLRTLGASNEIIEDDYKTLQFMYYVKFAMEEARALRNMIDRSPSPDKEDLTF